MSFNSNPDNRPEESLIHQDTDNAYIPIGHHRFFIPVMGTGFTIDTPLRVARYGICSVISIGDDMLIEQMREYHSRKSNLPYEPIRQKDDDARARRLQDYLIQVHDMVLMQLQARRSSPFEPGGEITRYFELIPSGPLRSEYDSMLACSDPEKKLHLQSALREQVVAGQIDANIMTKIDRELIQEDGQGIPESGVAMSALRGFATSKLRSSIVLSAGINKRLFAYMSQFDDFFPSGGNPPKKTITLKVSDYRSAQLQGTLLAKRGLWVSEFRIESGLNCGGHAFATKGDLMGPVLEEFQTHRASLLSKLSEYYNEALAKLGLEPCGTPTIVLSAQGGVGKFEEQQFLFDQYNVDRVGWGTPFLLVPEATNVDELNLQKLIDAGVNDVTLSDASPLGIPFWLLENTTSDQGRRRRIDQGNPGSSCPKQYLQTHSELSPTPICKASRRFQEIALDQLDNSPMSTETKQALRASVLSKTCLCVDLAGGVLNRLGIDTKPHTAICCGLSITDFDRVYSLQEMVDHIYGRVPLKLRDDRPNMFIRELLLYVAFFKDLLIKKELNISAISDRYYEDFIHGLVSGIKYYRQIPSQLKGDEREAFLQSLTDIEKQVLALVRSEDSSRPDQRGPLREATSKNQQA